MTIEKVREFIDQHMIDTSHATSLLMGVRVRLQKDDGIIAPKYVMKMMGRFEKDAVTRIYFTKENLMSDVIENWGKSDIVIQQFVV